MGTSDPRKGKTIVKGARRPPIQRTTDYALGDAFELFYAAKQADGMRDRTLADYRANWRYFREWLDDRHPEIVTIGSITQTTLREYVNYMMRERTKYDGVDNRRAEGAGLAAATVSIRLRSLRTMFNFWAREEMIERNPAANVKPPREDEDEIDAFTDEELRLLLSAPDVRTYAGFRDKVLMTLLADTGLRINEALALTDEHIEVKSRAIHLPGSMNKNRKVRIVPVSAECMRLLFELMNETRAYFETNHIFVTNYGDPMSDYTFRKRLKEYGVKVGLAEKIRIHPHKFRHYFCKMYILNGGDPFTLQRIVGHSDISTTRKYIQMDDESIRQQHAQFTPISRLGMSKIGKRRR